MGWSRSLPKLALPSAFTLVLVASCASNDKTGSSPSPLSFPPSTITADASTTTVDGVTVTCTADGGNRWTVDAGGSVGKAPVTFHFDGTGANGTVRWSTFQMELAPQPSAWMSCRTLPSVVLYLYPQLADIERDEKGVSSYDHWGCDNFQWASCTQIGACCDTHDQCYAQNGCTASSFVHTAACLAATAAGAAAMISGSGQVRVASGTSSQCLGLGPLKQYGNASVGMQTCNGSSAQAWSYTNGELEASNGQCLVPMGSTATGTPLMTYPCSVPQHETWEYVNGELLWQYGGTCLDATPGAQGAATIQNCSLVDSEPSDESQSFFPSWLPATVAAGRSAALAGGCFNACDLCNMQVVACMAGGWITGVGKSDCCAYGGNTSCNVCNSPRINNNPFGCVANCMCPSGQCNTTTGVCAGTPPPPPPACGCGCGCGCGGDELDLSTLVGAKNKKKKGGARSTVDDSTVDP
jgi:hypothetical protein